MDEKSLILFLKKNHRTPNTIRDIVEGFSLEGTKKLLSSANLVYTDEQAEEIASIRRKDFVESIKIIEGGGIVLGKNEI